MGDPEIAPEPAPTPEPEIPGVPIGRPKPDDSAEPITDPDNPELQDRRRPKA